MPKKIKHYIGLGPLRFLIFIVLTLSCLVFSLLRDLIGKNQLKDHLWARSQFLKIALPLLGIKIEWNNLSHFLELKEQEKGYLFVSNHRSYIDPVVLMMEYPFLPIIKMEVSKWPLLGKAISYTGSIYVNRESKKSRRGIRTIVPEYIKKGHSVYICPEGTSHIEPQTIRFHRGIFETAAENNLSIVPIAVEFENMKDAWVGDDTFFRHFFECFSKWETQVKVSIGPIMASDDSNELLVNSQAWIDGELMSF